MKIILEYDGLDLQSIESSPNSQLGACIFHMYIVTYLLPLIYVQLIMFSLRMMNYPMTLLSFSSVHLVRGIGNCTWV